jgi:hypothetical protein
MPAGPSEVLVIADAAASPVHIAADLLSQAEHGPDSQVVLLALPGAWALLPPGRLVQLRCQGRAVRGAPAACSSGACRRWRSSGGLRGGEPAPLGT